MTIDAEWTVKIRETQRVLAKPARPDSVFQLFTSAGRSGGRDRASNRERELMAGRLKYERCG